MCRCGKARRQAISLFDVVQHAGIILIGEALVHDNENGAILSKHAVVWDGWRRLLFIGPGEFDDRGLDGALQLHLEDMKDRERMDPVHGQTLSAYVSDKFGISTFTDVHALMVSAKCVGETCHVWERYAML